MASQILRLALLFLAPFILYGGWLFIARRRAKSHGPNWQDVPLMWLTISGLALMIGGLVTMAVISGDEPGTYVPARVIDGQVVPGQVISDPAP